MAANGGHLLIKCISPSASTLQSVIQWIFNDNFNLARSKVHLHSESKCEVFVMKISFHSYVK